MNNIRIKFLIACCLVNCFVLADAIPQNPAMTNNITINNTGGVPQTQVPALEKKQPQQQTQAILPAIAPTSKTHAVKATPSPKRKNTRIQKSTTINKSGNKLNEPIVEAQKWKNGKSPLPVLSQNGLVLYPYGLYQPAVTCKTLEICDIQLDKGEKVMNAVIGDSARWITLPGTAGSGDDTYTHLFLKPMEAGLETNMMITTNYGRTYDIKLVSSDNKGVGRIGFYYPSDIIKTKEFEEQQADNTVTVAKSPDKMNFNYKIIGDNVDWKPLAVNDDGVHTYIHFSSKIQEVPVFFVLDDERSPQQVNYRVKSDGSLFVIDRTFKHGQLIMGTDQDDNKSVVDIYNGLDATPTNSGGTRRHWFG